MEVLTSKTFFDESKIRDHRVATVLAQEKHRTDNAFYYPFAMNDEEIAMFQACFPRKLVIQDPKRCFDSAHPILANLNWFSNNEAFSLVSRWKYNKLITLSIGDSAKPKIETDHNCLKLESSRDLYRVVGTNGAPRGLKNFSSGASSHTFYCHQGSENCDFIAHKAVAVHSIYDITPSDMFKIFMKHGIDELVAFIYLPNSLYLQSLAATDLQEFNMIYDGDTAWFGISDRSLAYKHSLTNWKKWATITKIEPTDTCVFSRRLRPFCLAVERINSYGPLCRMRILRISYNNDNIPCIIPYRQMSRGCCLVPNIRVAWENDFIYHQGNLPHICVPSDAVRQVLSYANRVNDGAYKFRDVAAYFEAVITKIIVDNVVIRKNWNTSLQNRYDALVSLFVIGAFQRKRRTNLVSDAFHEDKLYDEMSDVEFLGLNIGIPWLRFKKWFHRLFKPTNAVGEVENTNNNDVFIHMFNVIELEDKIVYTKEIVHISEQPYVITEPPVVTAPSASEPIILPDAPAVDATPSPEPFAPLIEPPPPLEYDTPTDTESPPSDSSTPDVFTIDLDRPDYFGFFKDTATFKISDVLAMDHNTMEQKHDYIQWLFPTKEQSASSLIKPIDTATINRIKNDEECMFNFHRGISKFLTFLGYDYLGDNEPIQPYSSSFHKDRVANFMANKHNALRITRLISSCHLFGYHRTARNIISIYQTYKGHVVQSYEKYYKHMLYCSDCIAPTVQNEKSINIVGDDLKEPSFKCFGQCGNKGCPRDFVSNFALIYHISREGPRDINIYMRDAEQPRTERVRLPSDDEDIFTTSTESPVVNDFDGWFNTFLMNESYFKDESAINDALFDAAIRALKVKPTIQAFLENERPYSSSSVDEVIAQAASRFNAKPAKQIFLENEQLYDLKPDIDEAIAFAASKLMTATKVAETTSANVAVSNKFEVLEDEWEDCDSDNEVEPPKLTPKPSKQTTRINTTVVTNSKLRPIAEAPMTPTQIMHLIEKESELRGDPVNQDHIVVKHPTLDIENFEDHFIIPLQLRGKKYKSLIRCFDELLNIKSFPNKFIAGHCAIRSFFNILTQFVKCSERDFLLFSFYHLLAEEVDEPQKIYDYIVNGKYDTEASACIIEILCMQLDLNIVIVNETTVNGDTMYARDFNKMRGPAYTIHYNLKHYEYRGRQGTGGFKDKFPYLLEQLNRKYRTILETSAAPGHLIKLLRKRFPKAYLTAMMYNGPGSLKFDPKDFVNTQIIVYSLPLGNSLNTIRVPQNDLVVIDVGREFNTEELTEQHLSFALRVLEKGGDIMVKTFGDPHYLYETATKFSSIKLLSKPDGQSAESTERYFLLSGYLKGQLNFYNVYDQFHIDETIHTFRVSREDADRFHKHFFRDTFEDFAKKLNEKIPTFKEGIRGTFSAITGYASASKTTNAIKKYPSAKFISPTSYLRDKIAERKVHAMTPHVAFVNIKDGDHIVVDELSQFCVEYIALLTVMYPSSKITVLGDVYQTQAHTGKEKFTSFLEVGVRNNMIDVYAIPQDITNMLNRKYNWRMRTHSPVLESIYRVSKDLFENVLKSGALCLFPNTTNATNAAAKGYNAHTVTSFTGSRENHVVFIVDDVALNGGVMSHSSVIYTAVTRAKQRLFIVEGDDEELRKYFCYDGTLIDNFAQFSEIFFCEESYINDPIKHGFKLTIPPSDKLHALPQHGVELAKSVITDMGPKNANEPEEMLFAQIPLRIGPKGKKRVATTITTEEQLKKDMSTEDEKFFKVSELNVTINQSSKNAFETLRTMNERYAYAPKNVKVGSSTLRYTSSRVDADYAYSGLVKGLLTACYGERASLFSKSKFYREMRVDNKQLLKNAFAYAESLDTKLGTQLYTTEEINEIFDEFDHSINNRDAMLSFFNKRQSKHKMNDGFDTASKVGQGVASFEKKVNIIYGAYARSLLDNLKTILAKRNIFLVTHGSDVEATEVMGSMIASACSEGRYFKWHCNDYSEWDASFRTAFARLTSFVLDACGMPREAITWFESHRKNWKMVYTNAYGQTFVRGHEKQFSGNPFTIAENTYGNLALTNALFEFRDHSFSFFKGDDSAVNSRLCIPRDSYTKILAYTGHGLKRMTSIIGEFAGYILHNDGTFPDVYRYASKFMSKPYRDRAHFEEATEALKDRVATVRTSLQALSGYEAAAEFYTHHSGRFTSPAEVEILHSFLSTSSNWTFDHFLANKKYYDQALVTLQTRFVEVDA